MVRFTDMLKSAASSHEFRFLSSLFCTGRITARTCPNHALSVVRVSSPEMIFLRDVPFLTPFIIPSWTPSGTSDPFWLRTAEYLMAPRSRMGGGSQRADYLITEELASTLVEVHSPTTLKAKRTA